ncbi:MAG: TetR/AcrR family transcriptional regulator [Sphingopyxis sp.]
MQDIGLATALRAPVQGRSRQSYDRMMSAAENLLSTRGSGDFTLNEVSRAGKVSIGSIYNRFESKDALLHAVQLRVLDRVDREMTDRLDAAIASYSGLDHLVSRLIDALAETLKKHADLMRPLMQIASIDEQVSVTGKASYNKTATSFRTAILDHRDEIARPDANRAVDTSFRIAYAAVARYLGFGSATTAAWEGDWDVLKEDLAIMVAAFLRTG